MPTGASSGRISKPFTPSSLPNSLAEHSMPLDATPRIFVGLILKFSGSTAPAKAHGTFTPTRTLGAPHTICSSSPVPASTWVTLRRSASGCFSTDLTSATTTPLNAGAAGAVSSTSKPAMVSRWASWSGDRLGLACWVSHEWGNCMVLSR